MTAPATDPVVPAVHFTATLRPYRSLSPRGFHWVIGAAIAGNLVIGLPLLVMGAWPVLGFMGLDVWLLWFLFQRNYIDARRRETLVLDDHDLVVRRISPEGDEEQIRLDAYWLKVHWDEADERLIVSSRRSRAVIGRFLPPVERRRVADQLKAALAAMRAPRYRHSWDDDA